MGTNTATKSQTSFSRMEIAHNALNRPKIKYYIEEAEIIGNKVQVVYIPEALLNAGVPPAGDWQEGNIKVDDLIAFIIDQELNSYVNDSSDHEGNHRQVAGTIPISIYLDEYLNEAVGKYLYAGKEISHVS